MTVAELQNILEGLEPDTQIRLAIQPHCPLEYYVEDGHVVTGGGCSTEDEILYLAAKVQVGFLPGDVTNELDWR